MTIEVIEAMLPEAVTRTQDLPSNISSQCLPFHLCLKAIIVTMTRWKGHSAGTPLYVWVMCFKPVDSKNQRVSWCMNNTKLELFNMVSNFNFDRWCFLSYGSINQWKAVYCFEYQGGDVIAHGQLLSKYHRMVNAVSVWAWIHHCLLKELSSSKSNFNSKS